MGPDDDSLDIVEAPSGCHSFLDYRLAGNSGMFVLISAQKLVTEGAVRRELEPSRKTLSDVFWA
jgi:hypothetical protein